MCLEKYISSGGEADVYLGYIDISLKVMEIK